LSLISLIELIQFIGFIELVAFSPLLDRKQVLDLGMWERFSTAIKIDFHPLGSLLNLWCLLG
jgi:hypothetical protein